MNLSDARRALETAAGVDLSASLSNEEFARVEAVISEEAQREERARAKAAERTGEDAEGYPTVTIVLPLRSARASRDSLRNALCFLRGMRAGAGPDAEDGPEDDVLAGLRTLAQRLDEVVEPALTDFEGPHEMPF